MSLGELMENSLRLYGESEADFTEFMDNLVIDREDLHGTNYWDCSTQPGYLRVSMPMHIARILGPSRLREEFTNFFIPQYPVSIVRVIEVPHSRYAEFRLLIELKELPMGWDAYYTLKENQGLFNE